MNTTALTAGTKFEMDEALPYTVDGERIVHLYTKVCQVTGTNDTGFTYDVIDVVNEENRPSFAATPNGGSVAWFALPIRVAKGTLRVGA